MAQRVVVDGTLTTSRGPGTAFEFALSLVKTLYGEEKMAAVAGGCAGQRVLSDRCSATAAECCDGSCALAR